MLEKFRLLIENLPDAFAYHQMIIDSEGNPLDFVFLDVNTAFTQMTGLPKDSVVGKKVSEVFPGVKESGFDWIGTFGQVALTGETACLEYHAQPLECRLEVTAYSSEPGRFAVVYRDSGNRNYQQAKQAQKDNKDNIEAHQSMLKVLDIIDAFIYVVDMKTYEILFTNRYGEKHFGSIAGKKCWQVIHEGQTGPCEFCTNDKLLDSSGQPAGVYHREFRNTKNGRWYDCRDLALQWIDGQMVKLGIATDFTAYKQMEEKLKREKNELVTYLEGMLDTAAIWINASDEKGNVIYWNKAAEQISGYRAEEVVGHARVWDWLYPVPEHRKQILKMRHDIIFKGKKVENYETQIRSNDGQYRTLLWHAHNLVENGKIIGSIALGAEITEHKQAEKKLRISEERYRSLVDNANEAIIVIQDNLLVFANPMSVQIFGCSVDEITSAGLFEFLHPDDRNHILKMHKELLRKENIENPHSARLIAADGSLKIISNSSVLIEWEGRPAILCLMTDITEINKMQEEIIKADKLESIGLLAGGIAHDFNNYLATLLGNISLAKLYKNNFNKIYEKLESMEKAIHQAKNLSNQLFTFAKGGMPVKKIVSIQELIINNVKFTLSGTNVRCKFLIEENLQMVEVDEGQFSQVLNNIVINAVQAMPDGGIIEINAENVTIESESQDYGLPLEEGPYIKISIKDKGIGIKEKDLLKIFDPFFTTKEKGKGLGQQPCRLPRVLLIP